MLPVANGLREKFDVVLPDARGHGFSSAPESGYTYRDLMRDVVEMLDTLKLRAPMLAGHSMGGMTAAVAARELGSALRGLILIDPTFISPEWQLEVYESDVAADHARSLASTREDLVKEARSKHRDRPEELLRHLAEARLRTSPKAFELLKPPNPDWRELIPGVCTPTQLLIADNGVVSIDTARELQSLNQLLIYDIVQGTGHGLPYDKPAEAASLISRFADAIGDARTPTISGEDA